MDGVGRFRSVLDDDPARVVPGERRRDAASEVVDGQLRAAVESVAAWPDGVGGTVRIGGPDGTAVDAWLERVSPTRFEAVVPAAEVGTYGVAATLTGPGDRTVMESVTTATRSYGAEYQPGPADSDGLARLAVAGGGRTNPAPAAAFSPEGWRRGSSTSRCGAGCRWPRPCCGHWRWRCRGSRSPAAGPRTGSPNLRPNWPPNH